METALFDTDKPPIPSPQLKQLEIFLGSWRLYGQNFSAAPFAPNAAMTGNVFYQWMPGHFFMTSNWQRKFGPLSHIGMSVIGCDSENGKFFTTHYDNMGGKRIYSIERQGRNWKCIGDQERAEIEFSKDGNSYTENWEIQSGTGWQPLCELKVIKI